MSITKNTFYITGAFVFQKILTFFYIALVARNLGPEQTGQYFLALSFTTIFSVFVDLGLTPILIREVAKYKEKANRYFQSILTVKTFSIFLVAIIVALLVNLLSYENQVKNLVYIAILVMVFDSLSLTFYGILRAYQNLKIESLGIAVYQIFVVTFGGASLFLFESVYFIISILALASFLNALYALLMAKVKTKVSLRFYFDPRFNKQLFFAAWPFLLAGVFNRIYTHIDIVFISKLLNNVYVGWYAVANKLVFALQFIPSAFVASLYPALSHYFVHSQEKLKRTFEQALIYLTVISLSICFGALALSREIILTLYGDNFAPSVLPFRLLIISLVFVFLYFPIGSLLNASGRQKINTMNMGIAMLINVLGNLFLIPFFKLKGAALAAVLSQGVMLLLGIYYANQTLPYDRKLVLKRFLQNVLAGTIMFLFVYWLKNYFYWPALIIPTGALYFITLYLLGGFSKKEIYFIWQSLRK